MDGRHPHTSASPGHMGLTRWTVITFAGWCGGFVLALVLIVLVESLGAPSTQSPLPLGMGIGVGLAQARLLGAWAGTRRRWVTTTALALAAPFVVSDLAQIGGAPLPYRLWLWVAIGGLCVSVCQWALLRARAGGAEWWLVTSPPGWLLAGATALVADRYLPRIPGIVGALLYLGIVLGGGVLLGVCTAMGRRGLAPVPRTTTPTTSSDS